MKISIQFVNENAGKRTFEGKGRFLESLEENMSETIFPNFRETLKYLTLKILLCSKNLRNLWGNLCNPSYN